MKYPALRTKHAIHFFQIKQQQHLRLWLSDILKSSRVFLLYFINISNNLAITVLYMWVGLQELSEDGQTGMKTVYTVVQPKCFIFTASDPHIGCSQSQDIGFPQITFYNQFPLVFYTVQFWDKLLCQDPCVIKRLKRAKEKTLCMLKTVKDHPASLTTDCTALPSSTGASLTKQ